MTAKKTTTKNSVKNASKTSVFWTDLKLSILLLVSTVVSGFASTFLFVLKVAAMAAILTFPLLWCLQHMPFWVSPVCLSSLNPINTYALSCLLIAVANVLTTSLSTKEE